MDPVIFEDFYSSFWQQPVLLWVASVPFAIYFFVRGMRLTQSAFLKRYFAVFSVTPVLDAWLTAHEVAGLGSLSAPWATVVPLFFVILGDFRYFILMDGLQPRVGWRRFAPALGWSLVVPVATAVILKLLPATWQSPRMLFLIYETLFLVLALAWMFLMLPVRASSYGPRLQRATLQITLWVVAYYAAWMVADVLILAEQKDLGFVLRTLANLQYYGGFAPWAFLQLSQKGKRS
jgi:hypothetical protein